MIIIKSRKVVTFEGIEGVAVETKNIGGMSAMTDKILLLYLSGDVKDVCLIITYLSLMTKLFLKISTSTPKTHIFSIKSSVL